MSDDNKKLPAGWEVKRLGELFLFQNGRGFSKTEWSTVGLPIIRIQNLNNSNAEFNFFNGVYDESIEVNNGDLLFSWSGTIGSSFGPHIWTRTKGVLNQHIYKVICSKSIEKWFSYYCLHYITEKLEKTVNGAVGLVHITKEKLNAFEIIIPPLPEQKRIVAILDESFRAIAEAKENAEKNLANARELFEGYLNQVFANPGKDWEEKMLGDVCDDITVGHVGTMANKYKNKGIPFLRSQNIKPHFI